MFYPVCCDTSTSSGTSAPTSAQSASAQSTSPNDTDIDRTLTLPGNASPATSVVMNILPFITVTDGNVGSDFTPNNDGTLTVMNDVTLINVEINITGFAVDGSVIPVSFGIGDPTSLPTLPGSIVHRNVVPFVGRGLNKTSSCVINQTVFLTGAIGKKIFPVVWCESLTAIDLICRHVSFVVRRL